MCKLETNFEVTSLEFRFKFKVQIIIFKNLKCLADITLW